MGRDKESYINLFKKVCKKNYPELAVNRIECVETNMFDHLTGSWVSDGYTIFISIKDKSGYNIFEIEDFIECILGVQVVVTIH